MVVHCTACGQKLKVADNRAGETANCPKCGKRILLESSASPPPVPESVDEIAEAPLPIAPSRSFAVDDDEDGEPRGPLICPCCDSPVANNVAYLGQSHVCPKCHAWFSAPVEPGGTATAPARWQLSTERDLWVTKNAVVAWLCASVFGGAVGAALSMWDGTPDGWKGLAIMGLIAGGILSYVAWVIIGGSSRRRP